jgi:hypothetical protein
LSLAARTAGRERDGMRENLRKIYSGVFAEKDSPADLLFTGSAARSEIEDELDEWWPSFDRITADSYDNSLEVYFEPHVVDLEPTPEQVAAIFSWGFSRFWLNFQGGKREGGTERHYVDPEWPERRRAQRQRLSPNNALGVTEGSSATNTTAP